MLFRSELTGVEAKYAGLRSESLTNEVSLGKEALDIQKSINESRLAQTEITDEALLAEKSAAVERASLIRDEFEQFKAVKDAEKELRDEELRQMDELNAKRQKDFDEQLSLLNKGTAAYQEVLNAKNEAEAQYTADRKTKEAEYSTWSAQKDKELTEDRKSTRLNSSHT